MSANIPVGVCLLACVTFFMLLLLSLPQVGHALVTNSPRPKWADDMPGYVKSGCRLLYYTYGKEAVKAMLQGTVPDEDLDTVVDQQADGTHQRLTVTGHGRQCMHHHSKAQDLPINAADAAAFGDGVCARLPGMEQHRRQLKALTPTWLTEVQKQLPNSSSTTTNKRSSSSRGRAGTTKSAGNASSSSSSAPQMRNGSGYTVVDKYPLSADSGPSVLISFGGNSPLISISVRKGKSMVLVMDLAGSGAVLIKGADAPALHGNGGMLLPYYGGKRGLANEGPVLTIAFPRRQQAHGA